METVNLLLLTFDFHQRDKSTKSLAIANIEASINNNLPGIHVDTYSVDMNQLNRIKVPCDDLKKVLSKHYDYIALGLYAWCKSEVNELIDYIRVKQPKCSIILGGYEVNKSTIDQLQLKYANKVNHYIIGYAEKAMVELLSGKTNDEVINAPLETFEVPPVYQSNVIDLKGITNVRLETKRGCPFQCAFCAYNSLDHKAFSLNIQTIISELEFLNGKVEKVNIIDPIFTIDNYQDIINHLIAINFKPLLTLQVEFNQFGIIMENLDFLSKLAKLNVLLEFGFQSSSQSALKNSNRKMDLPSVLKTLALLKQYDIDYELSVIRGLPGETLKTYREMIDFFIYHQIKNVEFYPLTLLSNTPFHKDKLALKLETYTHQGMDYVNKTKTYTKKDYIAMKKYETYYKNTLK